MPRSHCCGSSLRLEHDQLVEIGQRLVDLADPEMLAAARVVGVGQVGLLFDHVGQQGHRLLALVFLGGLQGLRELVVVGPSSRGHKG